MQVQAIQGYFDGGFFYQQGRRVALPERQLVIVNVLDIPADTGKIKEEDLTFWNEFDKLARESMEEELHIDDFPRAEFTCELILFENED